MISLRSKLTQDVLGYFFLHEEVETPVNELSRRLGHDSGNLSRKLVDLEREGLLACLPRGNQRHYRLNRGFPLLKEYKRIVLKSVGVESLLREALGKAPGVEKAWLFGSYAADRMDLASDIDMLAVGSHSPLELQRAVSAVQKRLDREINLLNLTVDEYDERRKRDPFLRGVERGPRISLR